MKYLKKLYSTKKARKRAIGLVVAAVAVLVGVALYNHRQKMVDLEAKAALASGGSAASGDTVTTLTAATGQPLVVSSYPS